MSSRAVSSAFSVHNPNTFLTSKEMENAKKAYSDKLNSLKQLPHYKFTIVTLVVIATILVLSAIYLLLDFTGTLGLNSFSKIGIAGGSLIAFFSLIFGSVGGWLFYKNRLKELKNVSQDSEQHELEASRALNSYLMHCVDDKVPKLLGKNELFAVYDLEKDPHFPEGKLRIYLSDEISHMLEKPYLLCHPVPYKLYHHIVDFRYIKAYLFQEDCLFLESLNNPQSFLFRDIKELVQKTNTHPQKWMPDLDKIDRFQLTDFAKKCLKITIDIYKVFLLKGPKDFKLNLPGKTFAENFEVVNQLFGLGCDATFLYLLEDNLCLSLLNNTYYASLEDVKALYQLTKNYALFRLEAAAFYHFSAYATELETTTIQTPDKVYLSAWMHPLAGAEFILSIQEKIQFYKISHVICKGSRYFLEGLLRLSKLFTGLKAITFQVSEEHLKNLENLKEVISTLDKNFPSVEIIEIQRVNLTVLKVEWKTGLFVKQKCDRALFVKQGCDASALIEKFKIDTVDW